MSVSVGVGTTAGYFYDSLTPYGNWVHHRSYGWVWYPYNVSIHWRPYTHGHWIYTDYGWTWVSDYPWGWACFHYGRWFLDETYGWVWCPDTVWGPAWVCWRYSNDWIGWAPLPPGVAWRSGRGFDRRDDWDRLIHPRSYCFTRTRDFMEPNLRGRIEHSARNGTFIGETRFNINYISSGNRIINDLPVQDRIARVTGRPVQRYDLNRSAPYGETPSVRGREVRIFAPDEARLRQGGARPQPVPAQTPPVSTDLIKQQQAEKKLLEQQQAEIKRAFEERQKQEAAAAAKTPPAQIRDRQASEQQELRREQQQEQQRLQSWQQRERTVQSAPAAPRPQDRQRYNLRQAEDAVPGVGRGR